MVLVLALLFSFFFEGYSRESVKLDGYWKYILTNAPSSIPGEGQLILPGTLDAQQKSLFKGESDNTTQLRREYSFVGEAIFSKKIAIPQKWAGKDIILTLERTKPSTVRIDGKKIGSNSRISSPQHYDLTDYLTPGEHTIEIIVNNADSIPPIVARSSHAVSESTQTNWNGILGDIELSILNPFHIEKVEINDKNAPEKITVNIDFSERASSGLTLYYNVNGMEKGSVKIKTGSSSVEFSFAIPSSFLWSAHNPQLSDLRLEIKNNTGDIIDNRIINTGFRNFSSKDRYFTVNGLPVFLRGTVNAAVFPLTGYAPVDKSSWKSYFDILKDYGINHVRFHSWTPPEAAFQAADEAGIYLMIELPIWGELDRDLSFHNRFLQEELKGIMEAFSHHPSFVMFSPGNELWGDISLMKEYTKKAKFLNPRILATYGSNLYLGMNGEIGGEDFIVASKTGDNATMAVRGSLSFADSSDGGHFNSTYPNNNFVFKDGLERLSVPLVSHEVGQYQTYPDFDEISLYTGNLKADNLSEFKKRSILAGNYGKNKGFKEASGKWAAKLYKAEMELAQRSPGVAGFELFGLQDYPGQGTAIVGILNPFMKSKGFISPEEWRESSSDVSVFAEFPKYTFREGEEIEIPITTVNYSDKPFMLETIVWDTGFDNGEVIVKPGFGLLNNKNISFSIPKISTPQKFTLNLSTPDGSITNSYDFWAFPKKKPKVKNVMVTDNLTEALILLDQGEKVILCPDQKSVEKSSLSPLFTTDFWNYRMFRTICDEMQLQPSPGTLGLYIDTEHPALRKFPTDFYTDWQWYPIVANSRPLIIDRLPKDFDPIIEVIDNVERNFRLSLMLECKVGKGKLIILSSDMEKASEYPEGEWLLQSVKEYAASKEFKPGTTLSPEQVVNLVTKPSTARLVKELKNETYNSKWD